MKKLIVLIVLVAFASYVSAELHSTPTANAGFEDSPIGAGWSSWGSGSGTGTGWQGGSWGYVDTTGGANGSQNFFNATQPSNITWWGNCVTWRGSSAEMMDWSSTPGAGSVMISGWFKDVSGTAGQTVLKFEWVDFSGGDGGGGGGGTIPVQNVNVTITTDWAYYAVILPVPGPGTGGDGTGGYGIRPVWGNPGLGQVGLDDVYAVYIPEPMSIALLGLGGLLLRRKK